MSGDSEDVRKGRSEGADLVWACGENGSGMSDKVSVEG